MEGESDDPNVNKEMGADIYPMTKFKRSNQNTCITQKPIVRVGQKVHKGQVMGDGPCTELGELALGRNVIEALFPGWTDEVVAAGGSVGDLANDVAWFGHGIALKSAPSDLVGLLASRPVLEGHVRRRLLALPNVRASNTRNRMPNTVPASGMWRHSATPQPPEQRAKRPGEQAHRRPMQFGIS